MELQEEMFAMVAEWKGCGQTKKSFLANKSVSLPKFNYWCTKFSKCGASSGLTARDHGSDFREFVLSESASEVTSKVLELITPSGLRITVFG